MSFQRGVHAVLCLGLSLAATALTPVAGQGQSRPGPALLGETPSDAAVAPSAPPGSPQSEMPPNPASDPPRAADGRVLTRGELDPVVGSVDGHMLYLSDLGRLAASLPDSLRARPFESMMPILRERLIDHHALAMAARRAGLDRRDDVQRDIQMAADMVLEGAYLAAILPREVKEDTLLALYEKKYANRPPSEEARARHILLGTETEAAAVLRDLKKGADFATLARALSKDPDGRNGGDLGYFRRDQVWPSFADAVFSMRPGQIYPTAIHNEFGWHVVRLEERRLVAPPTFSEAREELRRELTARAVQDAIAAARKQMIIHRFNLDGSAVEAETSTR